MKPGHVRAPVWYRIRRWALIRWMLLRTWKRRRAYRKDVESLARAQRVMQAHMKAQGIPRGIRRQTERDFWKGKPQAMAKEVKR